MWHVANLRNNLPNRGQPVCPPLHLAEQSVRASDPTQRTNQTHYSTKGSLPPSGGGSTSTGIHAFLSRQSNHPHILDDPVAIQQIHPAIHKRIRPQPIIHTSIHSQNSMRPQPSSQCTRPINAHPFRASSASNDVQPYPPNQSRCREPLKTDRI